jgi:hypothetical protein
MKLPTSRRPSRLLHRAVRGALLVTALGAVTPALAVDFEFGDGSTKLTWDTTLTYGQGWRVQNPDQKLVAIANGGRSRSANSDDGTLNYYTGTYSQLVKGVTELNLNVNDRWGALVRGSALYDFEVEDRDTERTEINDNGKNLAGSYLRLLDAFAWGRFNAGDMPLEIRAGRQVMNWGESLFITGGLNSMNHFDVSALRAPGSEVKEGFLPQERIYASIGLTENLTLEGYYDFDWNKTEPEPVGSYFSTNDYVPRGGRKVMLGFGTVSDLGTDFTPLGGTFHEDFQGIGRGDNNEPDDQGQFGIAARMFLPEFGTGTEVGLYYVNYHSKLPLVSSLAPTQAGLGNALGAITSIRTAAGAIAGGLPFDAAVARAAQAGVTAAARIGGNLSLATATEQATIGGNVFLGSGSGAVASLASAFAVDELGKTSAYVAEYPEDIDMFGVSFNTTLGTTGASVQGELSYRPEHPLQFDDVELLFAGLSPLDLLNPAGVPACQPGIVATNTFTNCGQLGGYAPDSFIQGWGEFETFQFQTAVNKAFSNVLGATQLVLIGEVGVFHVADMPDQRKGGPNGRGLRLNGPLTNVSGNAELASRHPNPNEVEPSGRFASETSFGYRIVTRLEYAGLVGPWNVLPRIVWSDDVNGTSPGPGGAFVEGRHSFTFGVASNYLSKWELDLAYTKWGGAGHYNELKDRDNIVFSVRYSF